MTRHCGLLDHLVRPQQHRLWDGQPENLRSSEVDHQLELRRLLDGEVGRLGALEDLVYVGGRAPEHVTNAWPVRHEAAGLGGARSVVIARKALSISLGPRASRS